MIEIIANENQLADVARKILEAFPDERLFAFYGEMGAGKTTLIKEMCRCLGVEGKTSSPTFAIINEYFTGKGEPIYHFDFYRIENMNDLHQIGVDEYLESGAYCLMEWPEIAEPLLKNGFVKITIASREDGRRVFTF